jgi:undecaprenyl-diphosphatase
MSLDARVLLAVNQGWAHPWLDALFGLLSAKWGFSFPFLALVVALLLLRRRRDGLWLGLSLVATVLCADALGNLLKHLIEQPRPCLELAQAVRPPGPCGGGRFGMPSNHALNFFAAATFLGLLARRRSAWGTLFTLAAAVGLSRVYLGRHYPSQVLVGAAIGVAAGLLGWLIVSRLPFGKRARTHPQR